MTTTFLLSLLRARGWTAEVGGKLSRSGRWPVGEATSGDAMVITSMRATPASAADERDGLLLFLELELDGVLWLDGVTLRRSRDGRLRLAFPARTSFRGERFSLVRPRDREARAEIEAAVFGALGVRLEVRS
jgi:hypothetical protein